MGRRAHKPTDITRGQVNALASVGMRQEIIAEFIGIDDKTLRKHYADELRMSGIKANVTVAQSLFAQAKSGNVAAAIFWLKTRAGWSEKVIVEQSGPIQVETKDMTPGRKISREELKNLETEELQTFLALLNKMEAGHEASKPN